MGVYKSVFIGRLGPEHSGITNQAGLKEIRQSFLANDSFQSNLIRSRFKVVVIKPAGSVKTRLLLCEWEDSDI